jgi:ADP-heptose:LPS heptosyltransferase
LTHWVPDPEPEHLLRHEVRRQLDLVRSVGCQISDERMVLEVPSVARMRVLGQLQRLGVDPRSAWVVIHPGATAPSRRYPPEQFALAARRLVLDVDMQVIFTGSSAERTEVEQIQTAMGVHSFSLAGELDLGELAALLAMAPLLIANNTGPVHIAAAVGTPVVDLYALTNPQHTPWGVPNRVLNHDVPCKYCYKSVCPEGHHHCLALVPPEAVVEAVRALSAEVGRQRCRSISELGIEVHDASETRLSV